MGHYDDYHTQKAWWTDLRNDSSYTPTNKSIILVPKNQVFGKHSFGEFRNLKGRLFVSKEISSIKVDEDDFKFIKLSASLKDSAKQFYSEWSNGTAQERTNQDLGEIIVSRIGWRHITRSDRKQSRIWNSLSLLGVAKKIITNSSKCYQISQSETKTNADGTLIITDYLALKSMVSFPFRQSSLIQVVLKRKRKFNPQMGVIGSRIWFYSIYEPLSKK